eukprot:g8759.t1
MPDRGDNKAAHEIDAHASLVLNFPSGNDSTAAAKEEFVDIIVEFVELTSKSSEVAQALYRIDESAYRAACGRTHTLLSKKRQRPVRVPMKPDCLAIMQFGRGMKMQRREILERLREEEARQEYIKWELDIAIGKAESRARRVKVASIVWDKWCAAKNSKRKQNLEISHLAVAEHTNKVQGFVENLTEGAQFDEDAQGFRRVVAHGDEWMHSRLIHEGVEQRVRVEVALPTIRAVLEENARQISDRRGELAVIVQHVYTLAASRLQPFLRGALARRRLPGVHWETMSYAVEIQRVFRGYRSRGAVQTTLKDKVRAQSADLQGWASLVLQRQARVWLARRAVDLKRVQVGLTSKVSELADRLASSEDSRSVSAVFGQIDKDYRNYQRTIGEMKTREDKMATTFVDKVLEKRDKDVEGAWTRFVAAATEHGAGLKRRSDARRAHPRPISLDERGGAGDTHDHEQKLMVLTERYGIPAHAQTLPSAYLRAALPMHLKLRRGGGGGGLAPNTSAKSAPTRRPKRQRIHNVPPPCSGEQPPTQLEVGGAFASQVHSSVSSACRYPEVSVGRGFSAADAAAGVGAAGAEGAKSPGLRSSPSRTGGHGLGSSAKRSQGRQTTAGVEDLVFGSGGDRGKSCGDVRGRSGSTWSSATGGMGSPEQNASSSRWAGEDNGSSAAGWESTWDTERESRGLKGDAGSRFPGSSARQDMPSGLKECVERLCAAAFLRGHVPEGLMPKGTSTAEAYQRYLQLPPSLAKIRHEQLCTEASKPVASALRARGYTTLEQLLPPSKLEFLLGEAGAAGDQIVAAVSLARELKPKQDASGGGGGGDGGHDMFSPLSPFSRQRLLAGPRRTPTFKEGSRGGSSSRATSRGSRRDGRPGTGDETKKRKGPLRISLDGLGFEGGPETGGTGKGGAWDPGRYTSRPEEWIRPPPSVRKQRWDDKTKAFVPINNYSFDGLYRRHHPLDPNGVDRDHKLGHAGSTVASGGYDDGDRPPGCGADLHERRMEAILREQYGAFFDGMTPSARDLYQHMINDSTSWGRVDDPIGTLMRRAAFFVVEHPSPATRAELADAREKDLVAKGFGGKTNSLARPIALAGKFQPRGLEQELAQAALAGERVPMGMEAFREFVRQLDATSACQHHQALSPGTLKTSSTGRSCGSAIADPRRTLLERRFEAAATLADPFTLRLEADGVLSVKVLVRVPARAWGLPSCLSEEIERMLGLLTARTCASDNMYAHRGQRKCKSPDTAGKPKGSKSGRFCADEKRGGGGGDGRVSCRNKRGRARRNRQTFEFDPRFQRSPTDPFGRPPRLERIRPCLGPRQETEDGRGDLLPSDEDDLPPGVWDRPVPTGPDASIRSDVTDEERGGDAAARREKPGPGLSVPFSADCGGDSLKDATSELTIQLPGEQPQTPAVERKLRHQTNQAAATDKPAGKVNKTSKISVSATKMPEEPTSSSRFQCREHPRCGAQFSKASNLRLHERSHAAAPEYHRLRRAPQLGRDPPPASCEGAGAPAEKFRLRTTLPPSVRRELQQLQEEGVRRRRRSLLAGPGLAGTVATWAGVISPGRATFGQSCGV